MANYLVSQLDEIEPKRCPCGYAQRAFGAMPDAAASVHLVQILEDSRVHYHKRMTEIYVVLEGEGEMELDGVRVPVRPMSSIYIKPLCRHRPIGNLRIINIPIPAFDPADEWFD